MDFGDLFWLIPVVYLLRRVFFGRRKPAKVQKQPLAPAPRPSQPSRIQPAHEQKSRDELQEALGELGQALGLPPGMLQDSEYVAAKSTTLPPIPPGPAVLGGSAAPAAMAEETMAYDAWREPDYEADSLFASEDAFETEGTEFHADPAESEGPLQEAYAQGEPMEAPSPYERSSVSGHPLRRLAATASLREAVAVKELLDRPVALRGGYRLPFRG